jgi:hypothetical protein
MATGLGPVERVILKTSLGEIAIELKTNEAPETCRTIKALVRGGHYDGCCIYRAEPGFGTESCTRRWKAAPSSPVPQSYRAGCANLTVPPWQARSETSR